MEKNGVHLDSIDGIKRTRSGRVSMPCLAWYAGERLVSTLHEGSSPKYVAAQNVDEQLPYLFSKELLARQKTIHNITCESANNSEMPVTRSQDTLVSKSTRIQRITSQKLSKSQKMPYPHIIQTTKFYSTRAKELNSDGISFSKRHSFNNSNRFITLDNSPSSKSNSSKISLNESNSRDNQKGTKEYLKNVYNTCRSDLKSNFQKNIRKPNLGVRTSNGSSTSVKDSSSEDEKLVTRSVSKQSRNRIQQTKNIPQSEDSDTSPFKKTFSPLKTIKGEKTSPSTVEMKTDSEQSSSKEKVILRKRKNSFSKDSFVERRSKRRVRNTKDTSKMESRDLESSDEDNVFSLTRLSLGTQQEKINKRQHNNPTLNSKYKGCHDNKKTDKDYSIKVLPLHPSSRRLRSSVQSKIKCTYNEEKSAISEKLLPAQMKHSRRGRPKKIQHEMKENSKQNFGDDDDDFVMPMNRSFTSIRSASLSNLDNNLKHNDRKKSSKLNRKVETENLPYRPSNASCFSTLEKVKTRLTFDPEEAVTTKSGNGIKREKNLNVSSPTDTSLKLIDTDITICPGEDINYNSMNSKTHKVGRLHFDRRSSNIPTTRKRTSIEDDECSKDQSSNSDLLNSTFTVCNEKTPDPMTTNKSDDVDDNTQFSSRGRRIFKSPLYIQYMKSKCPKTNPKKQTEKHPRNKLVAIGSILDIGGSKGPGKGTLKRKKLLTQKLNEINEGYDDDFFEQNKVVNMEAILDMEEAFDEIEDVDLNFGTPKMAFDICYPQTATNTTSFVESGEFNCDKDNADAYLYRREKMNKVKKSSEKQETNKKVDLLGKSSRTDMELASKNLDEMLSRIPSFQQEDDDIHSSDLDDYYFSDQEDEPLKIINCL